MKKKTLTAIITASVYMLSCAVLIALTTREIVGYELSYIVTLGLLWFASSRLSKWVYNKLKEWT